MRSGATHLDKDELAQMRGDAIQDAHTRHSEHPEDHPNTTTDIENAQGGGGHTTNDHFERRQPITGITHSGRTNNMGVSGVPNLQKNTTETTPMRPSGHKGGKAMHTGACTSQETPADAKHTEEKHMRPSGAPRKGTGPSTVFKDRGSAMCNTNTNCGTRSAARPQRPNERPESVYSDNTMVSHDSCGGRHHHAAQHHWVQELDPDPEHMHSAHSHSVHGHSDEVRPGAPSID